MTLPGTFAARLPALAPEPNCQTRLCPQSWLPIGRVFPQAAISVSTVPDTPSRDLKRTFWQRRVRDPIVSQLTQGITPEKIALTIAVGSAIALFPIIGTTTLLCLLVGLALRLNQPIIQLINQALWPLHVPVILLCVRLGELLFGVPRQRGFVKEMHAFWSQPYNSFWDHVSAFIHRFGPTAWHAIVAWAVLAPFYVAAIYYLTRPFMRSVARLRAEAAAKVAAKISPPVHPVP